MMFSRFAVFYGHVWRSQFKNDGFLEFAKKEWAEGLSKFSDEILHKALLNCRDFCEMPPTLPQMIGYCRAAKKREEFFVTEPVVPVNAEIVTRVLQECKAMLNK